MSSGDLAGVVEVDPKTVERWLDNGRLPHQRHRQRAARALEIDEAYLWPQLLDDGRARAASQAEVRSVYPHRGAVPPDLWRRLVDDAEEQVDVLVYAGLFLVDSHPELPAKLAARAEEGLKARLLYGDPDSDTVSWRGEEEGIGENLAARIRLSLTYMEPVIGVPGVEVRQHQTVLYNSLYRFDDEMLVNTHVIGSPAPQNPVLHLQRLPNGHLFDHYLKSFDRVWESAVPLETRGSA
ncbi:hypothetical protein FB382_003752 [Nocardioides ginsengisegetis]|uniref:HTH cro/C1-type domain-containing protein n=1 Tax=Nocardioides ginsengisegetis TaxID=661491 RepID=A0A7W3J374_9ACTN|nr:XRE family transcriptional regulator [Nocardioides ginsengisegetis]MBA8805461.1 hypothetical protein [Nocardioides ginsengisegetis]